MIVRTARLSDTEAIVHVHYAAVHAIPDELYSSEIKEAWSRLPDEARYQWMRNIITQGNELIVVAEDDNGIVAFGVVSPESRELRALYVHPSVGGRGIGRTLVQKLESRCIGQGIRSLRLNASLNAELFYRKHGYRILQRDTFKLSADHHMACVKMEKDL